MGAIPRNRYLIGQTFLPMVAFALLSSPAVAGSGAPDAAQSTAGKLDQVLRENAVFFNMLLSFSYTAAVSGPSWGLRPSDINMNLISRAVRDARGNQIVRVRIAGVTRKNNNVELNILNPAGAIVGKGFLGYDSGQILFLDPQDRPIITGQLYTDGSYVLNDLRLRSAGREIASGFLDPCSDCDRLDYAWYDGLRVQVGGGQISASIDYDSDGWVNDVHVHWRFLRGQLNDSTPAAGDADYRFTDEATGAINSVLFDTQRSAESFFANPYSLVPTPPGRALLPRFTDGTGVAVTNTANGPIHVTYVARNFDGTLVSGDGIENPVTYAFGKGQQLAAYPRELFRGFDKLDLRPILPEGDIGWMEIYSDDGSLQAMFLDSRRNGRAFDGNIGVVAGSSPVVFPDLRPDRGESTEIELLNPAYDDVIVRLQLLDASGNVLREEPEYFVPGNGIRSFIIGDGSDFLQTADPGLVASLRITCNNNNSLKFTGCSSLIGLATNTDHFGSIATSYAVTSGAAAAVLTAPQFVTGFAGAGKWETRVRITKFDGGPGPAYLDLYDSDGRLLSTRSAALSPAGRAEFVLDASTVPWGGAFASGYLRVRSDSGSIAGDVSLTWTDGSESQFTSYPLSGSLHGSLQFNQIAQGSAGAFDYWTGIGLLNESDSPVTVTVHIYRSDGTEDRTAVLTLNAHQRYAALITDLLNDPAYRLTGGYIRLNATNPISAIVFYGDSSGDILSAVPGIPE